MLSPLSSTGVLRYVPQSSTGFGSLPGTDRAEMVVTNKAFSEEAKKALLCSSRPGPNITSHPGSSKKTAQNNSKEFVTILRAKPFASFAFPTTCPFHGQDTEHY